MKNKLTCNKITFNFGGVGYWGIYVQAMSLEFIQFNLGQIYKGTESWYACILTCT